MSLQDDIFDVVARLEGTPEAEQFDNIMKVFNELEQENDNYRKLFGTTMNLEEILNIVTNWRKKMAIANPDKEDVT